MARIVKELDWRLVGIPEAMTRGQLRQMISELQNDIESTTQQRNRARQTLSKIRGIVVALNKGIGSSESALRAIASILHVRAR
jgi:hypothetical protein